MMKVKKLIWTVIGIGLVGIVAVAIFLFDDFSQIKKDFQRLKEESYDTVFISMYPTDNYVEEGYKFFRAMQIVRCDYEIPNGKILQWYMEQAVGSGNAITTVYLGLNPEKVKYADVQELAQAYPDMSFEVVYMYPQITYWLEKSNKAYEKALDEYKVLSENLLGVPNIRIYFFSGEEWLICNKGNYETELSTNIVVSQFLMCNSDYLHPYILKPETVGLSLAQMKELIDDYRAEPVEYVDASGYDIVFLGDSIIGNFTDSLSVPEVVKALTNANVYNCGYGGKSAAMGEKDDFPVSTITEALVFGDMSGLPQGEQVYLGVESFLNRENKNKDLMFVINFGLNDYFNGYPVDEEEPYDVYSYSGALREAVKCLQENYPEALILLNAPNFVVDFDFGEGTRSEVGGKLTDYVEAIHELGDEMNVKVLDSYRELPITQDNYWHYMSDGCHLNERGRFLLGKLIAQEIE